VVAAARLKLFAPVVREPVLHKQIADAFRVELAAPGRISRHGVVWWSVDMAAYAGTVPGIRTGRGCIAGVPDIVVLWRGRALFIEVKASDGLLSSAQQDVATAILAQGGAFGIAFDSTSALSLLDHWQIPRRGAIRVN
jgi:hypothetical protein